MLNLLFHRSNLGLFSIGVLVANLVPIAPALAGQLSDGRSYFDHGPELVRSAASFTSAESPSIYQFTITVPQNAGSALESVQIVQEPNVEVVAIDDHETKAFLGNSFAGGVPLLLASVGGPMPKGSNEVDVQFNPPIQPGQTVTVSLDVKHNPIGGGVYLFGVTAYPMGDHSSGMFLGYGRFHLTR